MPQQIDRCASCSRPIYDADDVPGACACSEGIYHTLIARQREENHQGWRRTASAGIDQALSQSEPPTLDPSMFLSAAARRELAAAEQMRNIPRPVPGGPMRGRPSPMTDDPTDGFLDLDPNDAPQPAPGVDIEFNMEGDIDLGDIPLPTGRGERFRVDRPIPTRPPFVAERIPGPQGGPMREVARVGRFPIMREVDAQTREQAQRPWGELREVLRPGVEETEPTHTPTAAQLNARQQAEREAIHKTYPTAYERVASDFLSDADDFD